MILLTSHKNHLLYTIQELGFNPRMFEGEEKTISQQRYFVIKLCNSPHRFAVRSPSNSYDRFLYRHTKFTKSAELTSYEASADGYNTELTEAFKKWLEQVVRRYLDESKAPNLWETLKITESLIQPSVPDTTEFASFSEDEIVQIKFGLNEFRLLIIKKHNPTPDDLKVIDNRLQYLSEALDKHNKFDWKSIAVTTVITISIALSLDTQQGMELFDLFKQVFSTMLYLLP